MRLRRMGVLSCSQLARDADMYFSGVHAHRIRKSYAEYCAAASYGLIDWMIAHLPIGHRVRALFDYWNHALFYDIETDGLMNSSSITCIATYKAGVVNSFCKGRNLEEFLGEWAKAKILISFNGKRFDTPLVCKSFGLTSIPAQIDMMDEARCYGFRGGLKAIERQIGFARQTRGCNGSDAVGLWKKYCMERDEKALEKLILYNKEDVLSLVELAKKIMRLSIENDYMIFDN